MKRDYWGAAMHVSGQLMMPTRGCSSSSFIPVVDDRDEVDVEEEEAIGGGSNLDGIWRILGKITRQQSAYSPP